MTLSIYLHIPFCTSKCTYCAFNTYTKLEGLIPRFVDALKAEIAFAAQNNPYPTVGTVFFGGGTPTLLTSGQFDSILSALYENFNIVPEAEITTEANPNDLSTDYLSALRASGINRISIGMQSADDQELRFFARRHNREIVVNSVQMAREAGFDNINLDLMYGFPYQTIQSWQDTVQTAIGMNVEHMSLYALGLEDGTPLDDWVNRGEVPAPDDDLAADMYDYATDQLNKAGHEQYEISNWSKPGRPCHHNLQYWRNNPYIGLGPGAHGFAAGTRYSVIRSPQKYIMSLLAEDAEAQAFPLTPALDESTKLSKDDEISETLIMSLRLLKEGISLSGFQHRFAVDLMAIHGERLQRFMADGLLVIEQDRVRLTEKGRLLSNLVLRELV